ncbi:MAG: 50S ribosomal protein L10 [Chloroflexi bacterium]|nr:50S ribosomal protein L10 [Chloroflexota bacterium]
MAREKKAQVIEELEQAFRKANLGILTDYRGLTAAELGGLRRKLKASDIEYRVVKNTLARLAAERLGRKDLAGLFKGNVAVAFGYGEAAQAARVLDEYIRVARSSLTIKSGFLGASPLTAAEVVTIATLPPREVLVARVMGGLQGPISGLVNLLNAPIRGVAIALQARIKQLEAK